MLFVLSFNSIWEIDDVFVLSIISILEINNVLSFISILEFNDVICSVI